MIRSLELPFSFDTDRLLGDLRQIADEDWSRLCPASDGLGAWARLRSVGDSILSLQADFESHGGTAGYADTELLGRCAYFSEVLRVFQCPLKGARLVRLAPGSFIRERCDWAFGLEDGDVRLHIPIQTDDAAEFYLAGERLDLRAGGCFSTDPALRYRMSNRGVRDRIHLEIDARPNDWLRRSFENARPVALLDPLPGGFREVYLQILSDPRLQRKLFAAESHETLYAELESLAAERGLGTYDVEGTFPVDLAPVGPWLPTELDCSGHTPTVRWLYRPADGFARQAFFADELLDALRNPFARMFRHRASLPQNEKPHPTGLVFHMSRCGSTLVSHMLGALDGSRRVASFSEPGVIEDALTTRDPKCLRRAAAALGRGNDLYFLKLDAWHIRDLPLFREAFPETPWVFLYRDPLEVLVSHARLPGRHALPGGVSPERVGLRTKDLGATSPDGWAARVLANLMEPAAAVRDPRGILVNYRDLPDAVESKVLPHFGIVPGREELLRVRAAAARDAKAPGVSFQRDSASKRAEANDRLRGLAAELMPAYEALESLR